MNEDERKKNARSLGKFLLTGLLIIATVFGGYKWHQEKAKVEANMKYKDDTSYKVVTSRNNSYNGVYTLTKLDKNGKNTWDGLIIYVKNDKIVTGVLCNYLTLEELKEKHPEMKNVKDIESAYEAFGNTVLFKQYEDDMIWENDYLYDVERKYLDREDGGPFTGFSVGSSNFDSLSTKNKAIVYGRARCFYYDRKVDMENEYSVLNKMGIVPGYDEKTGEIWLSKLLKNKNSEYSKGYKLIHYKDRWDMFDNCELDDGTCIAILNDFFDANLKYE